MAIERVIEIVENVDKIFLMKQKRKENILNSRVNFQYKKKANKIKRIHDLNENFFIILNDRKG